MAADPRTIDELVEIFRHRIKNKDILLEISRDLRSVNDYGNTSVRDTLDDIRKKLKP